MWLKSTNKDKKRKGLTILNHAWKHAACNVLKSKDLKGCQSKMTVLKMTHFDNTKIFSFKTCPATHLDFLMCTMALCFDVYSVSNVLITCTPSPPKKKKPKDPQQSLYLVLCWLKPWNPYSGHSRSPTTSLFSPVLAETLLQQEWMKENVAGDNWAKDDGWSKKVGQCWRGGRCTKSDKELKCMEGN